MSEQKTLTRRELIGKGIVLGLVVVGASKTLEGCGGPEELVCSNATPDQLTQRTALGYVEHGSDPNKHCSKCNFWGGGTNLTACGNCQLNLGNVNPTGSCNSFAPKV
jgi:hypothetical protein